MGNTHITIGLLLAATLLFIPLATAHITTSQLGYHPDQYKQVVVYTNDTIDSFELLLDNESTYIGELTPSTCQGGQACLVGDFSNFTQEGTYTAHTNNSSSLAFRIDSSVYADALPIYAEFFNALRMQESSYHPGHHAAANPPLPMIADGSFILTTDQASLTLIRLGQAYEINPQALSFSVYEERPDIAVHIKEYADYLAGLQDHETGRAIPKGWYYNFNCPKNYDLQEGQHNQEQDECLLWDANADANSTINALTAYTHALPAITDEYGQQAGEELLERALNTDAHIQETYTIIPEPGKYGAALFILYDFTNESEYLTRAYNLREDVSTLLDMEWTAGEELYWNEYIKHEAVIRELGVYEVNDKDPRDFFMKQTGDNWHRVHTYGDHVIASPGRNFQQSRPMLLAVVQAEFTNQHTDFPEANKVSESQIAWLTGQNSVYWWDQGLQSRSFIFGIGENGVNQHIRLVQENFFEEEQEWLNGKTHINGWIVGAYDNSGDRLLEYDDRYDSWTYTESTNHMAALGVLAFAQIAARYNNQQPLSRPYLNASAQPINDTINDTEDNTTNACYDTLRSLPATCSEGDILKDSTDGCREVICESSTGRMKVLACNKPDVGAKQYFEIYKQSQTGTPITICLANVCIQEEGMIKSSDYPICPFSDDESEENISLEIMWDAPTQAILDEQTNSSVTITNTANTSFEGELSYYFNQSKQEASNLLNLSVAAKENYTVTLKLITQVIGTYNHSIRSADGTIIYAKQELTIQEQTTQEEDNTQNQQPIRRGGGGGGFSVEVTEASNEENTTTTLVEQDIEDTQINESQEELTNTTQENYTNTSQEEIISEEESQETINQSRSNLLTGAAIGSIRDLGAAGWAIIAFVLAGITALVLNKT